MCYVLYCFWNKNNKFEKVWNFRTQQYPIKTQTTSFEIFGQFSHKDGIVWGRQCRNNKLVATKPSASLLAQAVLKSRTCQNLVGNKVKFNFTTCHWNSTWSETYGLPGHHSVRLNTAYMLCLHCLMNLYLCVDGYVYVINGPVSWCHIIFERLTRIMGDNA